jgi:hypothetical protein
MKPLAVTGRQTVTIASDRAYLVIAPRKEADDAR